MSARLSRFNVEYYKEQASTQQPEYTVTGEATFGGSPQEYRARWYKFEDGARLTVEEFGHVSKEDGGFLLSLRSFILVDPDGLVTERGE